MTISPHVEPPVTRYRWDLLLGVLVLAIFAAIEWQHPWYFLQDDNRDQNLPYYIHNIRAILAGEFPLFNFHQYLGTPVHACIQSASLYLPNYLALILSSVLFGHYYGAMEFIALFHLLLAATGFSRLMQHFGLHNIAGCFGAIAWAFCGFVIVVGNSWIQVVGYAAYLPWILLFSLKMAEGFSLKVFVLLALVRVIDLFLGYPPYFIYTVTFDLLTVTVLYFASGVRGGWRPFAAFACRQAVNYLCVFLLAAPLLLPALHQVSISADRQRPLGWEEFSQFSYRLADWLNGLIMPFSDMAVNSWTEQQFISHIGYLTLFFLIAAYWQDQAKRKVVISLAVIALFSLLWASDTFVTRLFYQIPFHNRLRWPFKLGFFTSFYLIAVASFGFDAWYRRFASAGRSRGFTAVALSVLFVCHIANFLILYAGTPQRMFSRHFDAPPFAEPLQSMLADGRIVSICPSRVKEGEKQIYGYSVPQLGFNYATLFGLYHFAGYELLVSQKNLDAALGLNIRADFNLQPGAPLDIPAALPLDYFREWGVKWYVVDRGVNLQGIGGLEQVFRDERRIVLRDRSARPFVYWLDNPGAGGVPHRFTTNSIFTVTERATAGPLLVNVLYNGFFKADIDGKPAGIAETGDGQMLVVVPPGRHEVRISFVDPYFRAGVYVAAGFLLLAVIAIASCRFCGRRAP
ncbi:bacterial membrane protein YfhO [Geobacter sp. OR-1]|uniref:hypothetical protein n=1 Tax=Geobacter sp. OR-1 TaxID=1266765 RepID=UPI0005438E29|nr:hypothetical protein [Geobacter sp. OR-1]GAM10535.1 bacterial membrane protein YfhO [Geobacter sp. OR-1]